MQNLSEKNEPFSVLFRYSVCKEKNMTDISALLQEAKPLYRERKKRRQQIKTCLVALLCLGGFSLTYHPTDLNFNIDEELYLTETGGIIEDMGLPTDEFGLLKVS